MKITKTKHYSWKAGELAEGCKLCIQGAKSVLFITGLCSKHCFYCPISDKKWNKDIIYINEWPDANINDIIEEIRLCGSKGIGITGGDPLIKIDRCSKFIKLLKREFKEFHIHLYTPLNLVDEDKLRKLSESGLDEIRFHPELNNKEEWNKIELAFKYKWKIGIEIPAIPGLKENIIDLVNYLNGKVDFLNINELEISDTNVHSLIEKGFRAKNEVSYGVKGSEELALEILDYIVKNNIKMNAHYCTTKLKDRIQLARRIKRRALNVKRDYDILTKEGMLRRGVIYLPELYPSFGYNEKIKNLDINNKNDYIKKLNEIRDELIKTYKLKEDAIIIDSKNIRLITSIDIIKKIKEGYFKKAIAEEYPTYDNMIVELQFLE